VSGAGEARAPSRPLWRSLLKLARPKQWAKSAFVLIGPAYGLADMMDADRDVAAVALQALVAAAAFSLTSSSCYVLNDILDREADRLHPRKRRRPIASGDVSVGLARAYAAALFLGAVGLVLTLPGDARGWVGLALLAYVANVFAYSYYFKRKVIGDVVSLAIGFVLRVIAGCAAVAIAPSTWLLNVTFFLSMFLAFGKRLGERRTLAVEDAGEGDAAVAHRSVQGQYTDTILQMAVVVTAVATLMTYAAYLVQTEPASSVGFNPLWITLLPATYGLLRCIVLLESGRFDDPTELAYRDRGFIAASLMFGVVTVGVFVWRHAASAGM
jgi:decaprenyl-phosphate phosphoribosyltransferase